MTAVSTDCKKCHFTMIGVQSSTLQMVMVSISIFLLCLHPHPVNVSAADVELDLLEAYQAIKHGQAVASCLSHEGGGRRKRQAEVVDYKDIYNKVMANLSSQFINNQLSQTQKTEVTQIIKNTQSKLDGDSFRVLGLDRGNKTQAEVLQTLQQYRDSGNMTAEQNQEIQQLAVDTHVHMIRRLVPLLGLDHEALGLTEEQFNILTASTDSSESSVEELSTTESSDLSNSELPKGNKFNN